MDASQRHARALERALAELIPQLKDPRIPVVATIERVRLSADFSAAKVLVSTLREEDEAPLKAALERASGFLQRRLAAAADLRRTPRLSFHTDPAEVLS
ncbi:30S ribosome-binding factor RbfA [Truepera radiovictrix]|uniref:Ribosome-binding factor A n=1 Tax=Truepera radiovictrix (strain DSM 17093 / CIP 108686 / LMG 22925 / RQ-24) TaxID=649638 RepID=D7CWZ7_TRURR|nr:30S ribosome-binding factor RbfA [Truepera radiovictrix]ADI14505.1 ribosome-binding factor A [Truepera radiovictrix DSM 17093]WMT56942.1 30S ribosome-binding factor RbfA [Truepera radiovictrix]